MTLKRVFSFSIRIRMPPVFRGNGRHILYHDNNDTKDKSKTYTLSTYNQMKDSELIRTFINTYFLYDLIRKFPLSIEKDSMEWCEGHNKTPAPVHMPKLYK